MRRVKAKVSGTVHGVGVRFFTRNLGNRLGLSGHVRNLPDGSVEAEAEGEDGSVEEFVRGLRNGPDAARVTGVEVEELDPSGAPGGFDVKF